MYKQSLRSCWIKIRWQKEKGTISLIEIIIFIDGYLYFTQVFIKFLSTVQVDRKVLRAIADKPRMEHTAASVNLTISSCSLSLTNIENGHIIAKHDMPRISFASGGDTVNNIHMYYPLHISICGGYLNNQYKY